METKNMNIIEKLYGQYNMYDKQVANKWNNHGHFTIVYDETLKPRYAKKKVILHCPWRHHEYPEIHLEDELFLMWRAAVEGLCEDGRTPASLATQLSEGGHRVLAGQVLAARQRYHTLQYTHDLKSKYDKKQYKTSAKNRR